ncbi:sigma-54 interaction domain-containing protein [Thermodesulfobacteriota bacterium]
MGFSMIGVSENIKNVRRIIELVTQREANVLITGKTGVGKDVVAQNLYRKSNRFGKPFIKVNCAALPETLMESEMFGYQKGAFTGANQNQRGKFEQANGGVLFLDEIGDMPLSLQAKVLHVLQDGIYSPIGSERNVKTDTWIIAATNQNLEEKLKRNSFRQDLYYRLNAIKIEIEPLCNRPEDIPLLINHYIKEYTSIYKIEQLSNLSEYAFEKLSNYHWPGNVRELQNVLKRFLILGANENDIDDLIRSNGKYVPPIKTKKHNISLNLDDAKLCYHKSLPIKKLKKQVVDKFEKQIISYVLENTRWHRINTANILEISYRALIQKIKHLNIEPQPKSTSKILDFPKIYDPIEIQFNSEENWIENDKSGDFKNELNEKEFASLPEE